MAVDISVSRCCWVAVDCEMRTLSLVQVAVIELVESVNCGACTLLSLVQVTVVAGPPEEMQVRVLDAKTCSIGEVTFGIPASTMHLFNFLNCNLILPFIFS